jgi:hypothetical protein
MSYPPRKAENVGGLWSHLDRLNMGYGLLDFLMFDLANGWDLIKWLTCRVVYGAAPQHRTVLSSRLE